MIALCPNCDQRFSYQDYDVDYEHQCNSAVTAIDQEDVLKKGDYIDEVTGNTVTVANANLQGRGSLVAGHLTGIINIDKETDRGNRDSTHRQRQYFEFIELR